MAGVFNRDHTQLRESLEVAERAYRSLPQRGSHYDPCDVQPDTAPGTAAAAGPTDETALVAFTNPTSATVGGVVITDDDP